MTLHIYCKTFPHCINPNIKVIEFKNKIFDFDVCKQINELDSESDTLVFMHKISQDLSDLNNKIKTIKFFVYSPSINSLPAHLENLYLCFRIKNHISNLPVNLQNLYFYEKLYFVPSTDHIIAQILKFVTKIPFGCNLFITDNNPNCKKNVKNNYKNIIPK
jgi:hypothetical protein